MTSLLVMGLLEGGAGELSRILDTSLDTNFTNWHEGDGKDGMREMGRRIGDRRTPLPGPLPARLRQSASPRRVGRGEGDRCLWCWNPGRRSCLAGPGLLSGHPCGISLGGGGGVGGGVVEVYFFDEADG